MRAPDDYDKQYKTGDPEKFYEYLLEPEETPEEVKNLREDMNIKCKKPKWMKNRY